MFKLKNLLVMSAVIITSFVTSHFVLAATVGGDGDSLTFIQNIIGFIGGVLMPFFIAIAFISLVWGIIQYFVIGGSNDEAKAKGKSLIIYAIVGFVIILSFYGIVNILVGGIGLGEGELQNLPGVPIP